MWKGSSVWTRRARPETETAVRPFTYLHRTPPGTYHSPASYVAATTGMGVALPSPGSLNGSTTSESFIPLEPLDGGHERPQLPEPGQPIPAPMLSLPTSTASASHTSHAVAGAHNA